jgi:hypothetical protein
MKPVLSQDEDGFTFETEAMMGRIAPQGAYHGISQLRDKVSGRELIHPKYSALNLFRLLAVNQGMGEPRYMKRSVSSDGDAVTVRWAATEGHLGALEATYTVRAPATIDLTVKARTQGSYAGYEVFLSSYFEPILRPFVYLKVGRYGVAGQEQERVCPMVNDVFRGTVIVFPRDSHMARRCVDGRWDRNEYGAPTVQMCPVRFYSLPLAYLADEDQGRAVVLMAEEQNCASISTRYHAEDQARRMTDYSAFDFSLFGRDMLPEDEVRVRLRLTLVSLTDEGDAAIQALEAFRRELAE